LRWKRTRFTGVRRLLATGLLVAVDGRQAFLPMTGLTVLRGAVVIESDAKLDRQFERHCFARLFSRRCAWAPAR
jgi:hypothetical protein